MVNGKCCGMCKIIVYITLAEVPGFAQTFFVHLFPKLFLKGWERGFGGDFFFTLHK